MDLFNLLSYKLENFLNIRPCPTEFGTVFYREDEPSLLSVAARKRSGATLYVSRWHDLFSASAFEKAMSKLGFTEPDCYALLLVLSRFGYLFEIDNRQRTNKDYFIFFYLIQLITLKNNHIDADAQHRNDILKFLLFELSIDNETYQRFSIKNNQLVMSTDAFGQMNFLDLIDLTYQAIKADDRKENTLFSVLKDYQKSVVTLLTKPDGTNYRFHINDCHSKFMYPDVFLHAYAHHRQPLLDAIVDTVNPLQSTHNLFVSNIILMNYAFYIIKNNPREILKLKKHTSDREVFKKLLQAIISRRMAVNKEFFSNILTDQDLSLIKDGPTGFYNILYSL